GGCPAGFDHQDLAAWGRLPAVPFPAPLAWAAWVLPLLTLAAFLGLAAGRIAPVWFTAAVAAQVLLALLLRRQATAVLGPVEDRPHGLWPLAALMGRIEKEEFASPLLCALRDTLADGPASRALPRLAFRILWVPFGSPLALRP